MGQTVRGSNLGRGDFLHLSRSSMAPPSLMYKGNKVPLPGVKLPMRGFNHAKVKEKLDIYPLLPVCAFVFC